MRTLMNTELRKHVLDVVNNLESVGEIEISFVISSDSSLPVKIFARGYMENSYESNDYFGAFLKLRKDLEEKGSFLACRGCLKTVLPSGMSRDWSGGLTATEIDEKTLEATSVYIFESIDENQYADLCTYCDQVEYKKFFIENNKEKLIERTKKYDDESKKKYGY